MRVLLEKVMLDLPRVVVAELIRQLELRQRVVIQPPLTVRVPRTRQLQLVEDAELHRGDPLGWSGIDARWPRATQRPRGESKLLRVAPASSSFERRELACLAGGCAAEVGDRATVRFLGADCVRERGQEHV